ncbi:MULTISPECIES: FAD-dependent oxidoreductase [unclassified Acinetobacter]|uniref:NAD(P)/FAD-dependent oxidoreductase n=1 Tax=unclassified Acinetobacter TaxID=196816 RepID=UPI00293413A4|nr:MULTISPECIES: FAD-dependent oxidoreductase [unclassified Acinetobacter]WOE31032.1 FAD-dependent oxidoreductase [Acinetobacter sp. SAAs470]WOE39228.1 FAD-dependent oxidoreductase [Acinetobacter sp. SAAs474]
MHIQKPKFVDDVEYKASHHVQTGQEWNWLNPDRGHFDFPANYYESSLETWAQFATLDHEAECDVVVIGGGLLGCSTALHLAEQGVDTILVEKNRIGSAASGRNGGQLTPGLARWEASEMLTHFGYEDAKRLWHFTSTEAMSLIDQIIDRYQLDLQRKSGHITAAVHEGHLVGLTQAADARKFLGESHTKIMGQHELMEHVVSEQYCGGLFDRLGGQIHPLALNRGLAYAFHQQGGKIYEQTEVIRIDERDDAIYVHTAHGVIKARQSVVIAVHHGSFKLLETQQQTTIPFYTYVCTTAPLEVDLKQLLPTDAPVYDTQFQIDYYRGVSKNRLLFGGEGTGSCWGPAKTEQYLQGRIRYVFPQLAHVKLDFVWSGTTDLTVNGATDSRKFGHKFPIYAVHGWSGHGVAQTVRIGKAIADDFCKKTADFTMLTSISHKDILFGRALAPLVIPMAKSAYAVGAWMNPGKMVSF